LPNFEKRFILSELFKNFFRVEKRHIDLCLKIVNESKHSNRIILPKDYIFEKSYDNLYFFKKDLIKSFQVYKEVGVSSLEIEKLGKKIAFLNHMADKNLLVRNRKKGDRIKGKKLKDIFIDKKIDLFIRDTAIVVEENGEIVFVEGVLEDKDIKISWSEYGAK
jgi:tRNA(Ile)-lysidine synthase